MRIIVALIVFGIIVIFHEFGHFLLARLNGITVNEFSIGMGPKLFGIRRGETEYTIRALPIGGACMMQGEDTPEEDLPGSFNSKSVWARISVVLAGPFFNFIMAFICGIILIGMSGYMSGEIVSVEPDSPAMTAGLQAGDIIVRADHTAVHSFTDFRLHIMLNQGNPCEITYKRNGETQAAVVTPRLDEDGVYRIGIVGGVIEKPGAAGTVVSAFYEVRTNINLVIKSLEMLIQGQVIRDEVSGPVGIFSTIGDSYDQASKYGLRSVFLTLVDLILLLSSNLGVMNLLPIPALDGGRLIFLFLEAIRGKPISREKEGMVHFAGFVLLMGLMVLIMINDFSKIFGF